MQTLVIGYGNTLRGDDGVGYRIAELVDTWQLPHMRAIACQQLTPELAIEIAASDRVFFVDATWPETSMTTTVRPVPQGINNLGQTHDHHPTTLMGLAASLYQATAEAYQILIPTRTLALGEQLSDITQVGMNQAVQYLRAVGCPAAACQS